MWAVVRVGPGEAIAIPAGTPHAVFTLDGRAKAYDSWSPPFRASR
jgi:mannose-6-phosphate isomerase-like protein (cupin superfamily)